MKIIVDTNIIFSALLNTKGTISDLIFNSYKYFKFYSCDYMKYEIEKHWDKLKRISKLSDYELKQSQFALYKKINFINEELIPQKTWLLAEKVVEDIDEDDVDFVALTIHLRGYLWTGDLELFNGLTTKNFKKTLDTNQLKHIRK